MSNLSEKLKAYRAQHDLTQEGLAKLLFVSRQAVSKWEQGRGYPSIPVLELLSKLMNVSLDSLISNEESKVLSLQASVAVKKSSKKFIVLLLAFLLLLAALIVYIAVPSSIKESKLKGVVGFYADMNGDMDISKSVNLLSPNKEDVYYYKNTVDNEYVHNGVFLSDGATQMYKNGKAYCQKYFEVYLDISKRKQYTLYAVVNEKNKLKLVRWEDVETPFMSIHVASWGAKSSNNENTQIVVSGAKMWVKVDILGEIFESYDVYEENGDIVGNFYQLKVTYLDYIDLRLLQYDDKNEVISDISINQTSTVTVQILPETKKCAVYKTRIVNGEEIRGFVDSFAVSDFYHGYVYFANESGFADTCVDYVLYR